MFGKSRNERPPEAKDIGLLGVDTRFEGTIRFAGTLRIDGTVVGGITAEPGQGSVLIINQDATVTGDIVSDSVLISGRVEGNVHARERVEIFRAGVLKGDVYTSDIMIEGGAEFQGYCHMADGELAERHGAKPSRAPRAHAGAHAGAPPEAAGMEEPVRA